MNPTLNYAVDDENFSWNKSLGLSKEKYLISIKPSIINLILENTECLLMKRRIKNMKVGYKKDRICHRELSNLIL